MVISPGGGSYDVVTRMKRGEEAMRCWRLGRVGRMGCVVRQVERGAWEVHGAANLYTALNVGTGEVLGGIARRRRATEWKRLLGQVDGGTETDLVAHLVADRRRWHGGEAIRDFLSARPPFSAHSGFQLRLRGTSSWLKAVGTL